MYIVRMPTHADLVLTATRWLRGTMKCAVVLAEVGSCYWEIPDAIGWAGQGRSILVECKTSRADFLADRSKPFRVNPETGMGRRRYYLAPQGLIKREELPENWGLLETYGSRVKRLAEPAHDFEINSLASRNEALLLVSAVKRATDGWGCKVFADLEIGCAQGEGTDGFA